MQVLSAKFVILKNESYSMAKKNFSVIYYGTLKDAFWFLRLERRKNEKQISKSEKICTFCQKMLKFVMLKY